MSDPIYPILKARWKVFTDANSYQSVEYGQKFEPTLRTLHFRTYFDPNDVSVRTLASGFIGRENGIFLINVYSPEANRELDSRNLAWDVRAHFYPNDFGIWLTSGGVTVRIESPPSVKKTIPVDGYLVTPVAVRWFADLLAS